MSARSLKSNSIEQKKLQESFSKYQVKYFYERKDGQFEGLLNFSQRTPSFRPSDYQITSGKKRFRILDNEDLANAWLSFIGFSAEMLRGGVKLFDNDDLYKKAFMVHPNKEFWMKIIKAPSNAPLAQDDSLFEDGPPGISQYLLAFTVSSLIKQRKISFNRNRSEAIERLKKKGAISLDYSGHNIDDITAIEGKLNKDNKYYLGIVLNNMHNVLIELYSMILCRRYGVLDEKRCYEILRYPPIRQHLENPFTEIPADAKNIEAKHILNLIYEFLRFALEQYIIKYGDVVRAQPRLKSYLAQRSTVDQIRDFVMEVDVEKIPGYVDTWCSAKEPFIKQLPEI